MVSNEKKPMAMIGLRGSLQYYASMQKKQPFYLSPKIEESTFSIAFTSIAFRKGFEHRNVFDKM